VGERRSGRLERMLADSDLASMTDLGSVDRRTLAALYARADGLLFPSRYEGFGIPLVEAMRYGTPVIASDRGALPEVLGDAGDLLDPDDVDGWANAIARLLDDEEHRTAMQGRSHARAAEYTWERTWRELDPILTRLAA
jgi:glycosyltransferase involved in cell wall biosynthesis